MEKCSLIHLSDSIYSFPIDENHIELRLLTKKNDDIIKVELIYNDKYSFHEKVLSKVIDKVCSDDSYDYYIIQLELKDLRFAYVFKITTLDGKSYYFSESGITEKYDISKGFYDFFQVSYINSIDLIKKNKKFQNRVFYQIFVDRFNRSSLNNNPRINTNWGENVNQKSILGGDLKGIIEKIDYLKDLNIDALYLTPIYKSSSNHKYNIEDHFSISKDFGTKNDLKNLVDILHKNNILIVLDGVYNHISSDNKIFLDVVKKGKKSKFYNWFFIKGDYVDLVKINYETFASDKGMPRLNLNNPNVQKYVISNAKYYAKHFKIDGLRLDVSDEIPHNFWIEFKKELLKINKDFILIGENWHNSSSYLNNGNEFDSIMNYSITKELLNFIAWETYSPLQFKNRIVSNLARYKTNVNYNLLNLLSSHDVYRFLSECKVDYDKFILAYAFLYMHIGIPCLYYGDEIGLEGNYDPDNRRCFIWESNKWNYKVHYYIKNLIKIHKEKHINERSYTIIEKDELIYVNRIDNNSLISLVINMSNKNKEISLKGDVICSNLYENEVLNHKGFIIIQEEII